MIKIFTGEGGDTLCTPFPLHNFTTILVFTHPLFQDVLERFFNDPPPPIVPLQASFTVTLHPIAIQAPRGPPHNIFDRTQDCGMTSSND